MISSIRPALKKALLSAVAVYSRARRLATKKTKLLFYGRNPMNYTMFRPIHKRIEDISRSDIFFCFQTPDNDYSPYVRLGVPANRILSLTEARMRIWDSIVLADFKRPRLLWADKQVYICHGVAAKNWTYVDTDGKTRVEDYRYHEPLRDYDLVFFHNGEDYRNAKQKGLFKRENSGEVIGMCCLDEVVNNHAPEKIRMTKAKYIPPEFLGKNIVLYAPTWDSTASFRRKGAEILTALSRLDAFVIVKPHPLCVTSEVGRSGLDLASFLKKHFTAGNYLVVTDTPYEIMPITDMIISDFSSITFEYSLLRKPIFLFEGADNKIADTEQYKMLRGCCFVFRENEEITPDTFSRREPGRERIAAMEKLQERYLANPGFATHLAAQALIERGIIIPKEPDGKERPMKFQAGKID